MDHPTVLIIGLALSIALMGFAARLQSLACWHKYRWIAYLGLAVILYVAIEMTLKGAYGQWPEQLFLPRRLVRRAWSHGALMA
jgi:predicted tellurium resistance membrane protein TerC